MKLGMIVLLCTCALMLSSCGDDDGVTPSPAGPDIDLVSPNGGETFDPGSQVNITWVIEGAVEGQQVATVTLSYRADGMSGYEEIAVVMADSSYAWTAPSENLFGVYVKAVATDASGETGEDESDQTFAIVKASERGYVTSEVCKICHEGKYNRARDSGLPWMLTKIENGEPPSFPFSSVPDPPEGFSWDDISYVIGGYGWRARFMNSEGYIITTGVDGVEAQYNIERDDLGNGLSGQWVSYEPDQQQPKEYTCGACHSTGWLSFAENGGKHQDGLVGILGTWEEPGVRCERCHASQTGGARHVATQSAEDINIDRRSELCGECHFRDTEYNILASQLFIRNNQQYVELISARHSNQACTDCHDPHVGVRYGHAASGGITVDCEICHGDIQSVNHLEPLNCIDCHMPRASRSARSVHAYEGDLRTHIFKINADPLRRDDPGGMFFEQDGATLARGFLTVDFVCFQCHTDSETGEGGGGMEMSLSEASDRAKGIHN